MNEPPNTSDNQNSTPGTGRPEERELAGQEKASVQKVACPSCSEVYEVNIPDSSEERSITICPFCDQKFFIKHDLPGKTPLQEQEPEEVPPETLSQAQTQPDPGTGLPPSPTQEVPDEDRMFPLATPTRMKAPSGPTSFKDSPVVQGLKAASFNFLKRLPLILIPVLGALYLITLGVYDAGRKGASTYMKKNGGRVQGAFGMGLLFGLIFASVVVLLIYLIFSLLAVTVFLAFSEMAIFVFVYAAAVCFSALGSKSATLE